MRELLKAPDAMALLQVKPTKFYAMQKAGLVIPVSLGPRCKRYDRRDIYALIQKLKSPVSPNP